MSRYGIDGKASLLRRHSDRRRLATLLATAVRLTTRAVDDALDLSDVLSVWQRRGGLARPCPVVVGCVQRHAMRGDRLCGTIDGAPGHAFAATCRGGWAHLPYVPDKITSL
ncbi:hypothetical protein GCM10010176_103060 [Nonomuraea spiralis]|nr:hypothetical protein GCM10010176_103060 [Nonomuraea spiralis]